MNCYFDTTVATLAPYYTSHALTEPAHVKDLWRSAGCNDIWNGMKKNMTKCYVNMRSDLMQC